MVDTTPDGAGQADSSTGEKGQGDGCRVQRLGVGVDANPGPLLPTLAAEIAKGDHSAQRRGSHGSRHLTHLPVGQAYHTAGRGNCRSVEHEATELPVQMPLMLDPSDDFLADIAAFGEAYVFRRQRFHQEVSLIEVHAEPRPTRFHPQPLQRPHPHRPETRVPAGLQERSPHGSRRADAEPPFFLNGIGKWFLENVSMTDEHGKPVKEMRGLYCTNCHNFLSQELYVYDDLTDAARQEGRTMRNKPIKVVMDGDKERAFKEYQADPVVGAKGEPLYAYYAKHKGATLVKAAKTLEGKAQLLPWNADKGEAVPYESASAGSDWWLSASEPHCADCHVAPFVESQGGLYFPIDQPNKYSLYRYSKAHGAIACQSCHESTHGLYPVRYDGPGKTVDMTTHEQALQYSPDGKYAGPVTCAACHTVGELGVPVQLKGTGYYKDYWASVVLIHFMRDGDQELPAAQLVKKYPYEKSREVVVRGWR